MAHHMAYYGNFYLVQSTFYWPWLLDLFWQRDDMFSGENVAALSWEIDLPVKHRPTPTETSFYEA